MNNKGFMMAEVVVVSAVILVTLSVFYVNYSKLITLYNERLTYYDPETLYKLAYYRDEKCKEFGGNGWECLNLNKDYEELYKSSTANHNVGDSIYLTKAANVQLNTLKTYVKNTTFDHYIDEYLKEKIVKEYPGDYILVMQSCDASNVSDAKGENCKYAYLNLEVMKR